MAIRVLFSTKHAPKLFALDEKTGRTANVGKPTGGYVDCAVRAGKVYECVTLMTEKRVKTSVIFWGERKYGI